MGDESPPRSRSPAPRDDRSRSPARGGSPPRGGSPRGRDVSRSRSRSPRRDDPRPPSRDRSPGRGGGGGRKTGVAGRWNPRGFGACGEPPNRPVRPLLSRARPRPFPPAPSIRDRPPFRAIFSFHPPRARSRPRARPPGKHARSTSRPSFSGSTATPNRVATRQVVASSRASSVRPHPHLTRSCDSSIKLFPRRPQASSPPTAAARTSSATSRASPTATCSRKARAWSTTSPTTIARVSSAPSA